jgi:hypothetical protein
MPASWFEPLPAVAMRATLIEALERGDPAAAALAVANAPERESVLARALLALAGVGDPKEALLSLGAATGAQPPPANAAMAANWARHDPLAFALDRLLRHRLDKARPIGPEGAGGVVPPVAPVAPVAPVHLGEDIRAQPVDLPEALAPFERLLSGRAYATHEIWLHDASVLPPSQALAAALAMQEACGGDPDWTLLKRFPCFTLPLLLMIPGPP